MKKYTVSIDNKEYSIPIINSELQDNYISDNDKLRWILDVGQDQLTHKAYYLSKAMEPFNIKTVYLAADKTGLSDENIKNDKLIAEKIGLNPIKNAFKYIKLIRQYKPLHIELLLDIMPWDILFFVVYARLKKIKIVTRCRGGELLEWRNHRSIVRFANKFALKNSNLVLIRELFMVDIIVKNNICPISKVAFFHNHVPVPKKPIQKKFTRNILYLNSLKEFRHPSLMIDIAKELIKRNINFKFIVVGFSEGFMTCFNTNIEERKFTELIEKNNLKNYFEIYKFTNNTTKYYTQSSIFILPSDFVFCNHSLIEAMSHQLVPIVQNVEGSNLIIDNGKNGYLVNNDPIVYADKIEYLFENEDILEEMGKKAYESMLYEFNSNRQAEIILEYYRKNLW